MSESYDQLAAILGRYLSPIIAEGIVSRALRDLDLLPRRLTRGDLVRVVPRLESGIRLFLDPPKQLALRGELEGLLGGRPPPTAHEVPVRHEPDISTARLRARSLCEELGVKPLGVQKIATIVSELARNIVNYTPGGAIELAVVAGTPRCLRIRASDRGAGIPNLDEILSGRYRSKTGMGKGIVGVKRLSDRFEIQTGRGGTRIAVEVIL